MAKAQAARGTGGGGTMQTVRGWLTLPLALLIVLTGCMAVLSALVIEVQAGATSWIIGESHWSKAQQESVYWLERYLGSADPADLQAACRALEVPLGDRAARLAVDASPIDWAEVYAGLAAGRNAREDMPQMVRLYRYGQRLPYLGSAIALWKHTDGDILHLSLLADRAASAQATGTPDARAAVLACRTASAGWPHAARCRPVPDLADPLRAHAARCDGGLQPGHLAAGAEHLRAGDPAHPRLPDVARRPLPHRVSACRAGHGEVRPERARARCQRLPGEYPAVPARGLAGLHAGRGDAPGRHRAGQPWAD